MKVQTTKHEAFFSAQIKNYRKLLKKEKLDKFMFLFCKKQH
jgi:hypothetical protein